MGIKFMLPTPICSYDTRIVLSLSLFFLFSVQVKLWNVETKECAMAFKGHNAEASTTQ